MTYLQPLCTEANSVQYGAQHGGDHHDAQPPLIGGGVHGDGAPAPGPFGTSRKRTECSNPFRESWHRRMGGKYVPTRVDDHNQRAFHEQERAVSFERARREAIEANQRGEWLQPF